MIHVSAFDIERGRKNSHTYHPIARAVWHQLADKTIVQLIHEQVMICDHGFRCWLDLPMRAVRFAREFNDAMKVTPISFTLPVPPKMRRKRSAPRRNSTEFPFFDPQPETVD